MYKFSMFGLILISISRVKYTFTSTNTLLGKNYDFSSKLWKKHQCTCASLEMSNHTCPNTAYDLWDPGLHPHFPIIVSTNSSAFYTWTIGFFFCEPCRHKFAQKQEKRWKTPDSRKMNWDVNWNKIWPSYLFIRAVHTIAQIT